MVAGLLARHASGFDCMRISFAPDETRVCRNNEGVLSETAARLEFRPRLPPKHDRMRLFAGTKFDIPPKCDRCGALVEECACPPPPPEPAPRIPPEKQRARLAVEKRQQGKVVTVIRGLPAVGNDLPDLLSRLKTRCGAGGAIKEESIEIQGDHREPIRTVLGELGYRVQG